MSLSQLSAIQIVSYLKNVDGLSALTARHRLIALLLSSATALTIFTAAIEPDKRQSTAQPNQRTSVAILQQVRALSDEAVKDHLSALALCGDQATRDSYNKMTQ
jgi:hypothetical protein